MKLRKVLGKVFSAAVVSALLFSVTSATVRADVGGNDEKYTYTVTIYAGMQGSFGGTGGVQVSGSGSVSYQGGAIRITGLDYGDRISVNAQSGMVSLPGDSKYYVQGVRESGRDNDTVGNSSFVVDSDKEYVVAYGIKGNMVSYQVNYQDAQGNPLLESQTFYGAVGDKPVVAFQYVEGYQPQAYNLTGTLSGNEADNVFTFVYTPIPAGETDGGEAVTPGAGTGGGAATPGTGGGTAAAPDDETAAEPGAAAEVGEAEEEAAEPEAEGAAEPETEEQAAEPEELVDIDEDEVPLGNLDQPDEAKAAASRPAGNMPLFIGLAAVAVLAIAAAIYVVIRSRRKRG